MKIAALVMLLLVGLLASLAWMRGGAPLVREALRVGGQSTLQLLPLLVIVFLLTGFVQVLLPRETVVKWLSDSSGMRGLIVAWIAGAITPGGGPIGLPIAAALLKSGAGMGVLVTYLTSMSLLSFVRVPLEIGIYGLRLTAFRIGSSCLLPLLAGLVAQTTQRLFGGGP